MNKVIKLESDFFYNGQRKQNKTRIEMNINITEVIYNIYIYFDLIQFNLI